MSGHQSDSDRHQKRGLAFWVLIPKGQAIIPRNVRRLEDVVIGLDADHVDLGGHRHRDGPGLVHQVTVTGDVISRRAPYLIIIRNENFSPRLDLIRAEVGAIAPKGALYFLKK